MANYFECLLLEVVVGNDTEISIPELEVLSNVMAKFKPL